MASQQVKGIGATSPIPTAAKSRNIEQNVEGLYNTELVTRVFEDGSITTAKLVGGGVIYRAFISQAGTANPTIDTVLLDEIGGTLTPTRTGVGVYLFTQSISTAFPIGKVSVSFFGGAIASAIVTGQRTSDTEITVSTSDLGTQAVADIMLDNKFMEIRVYP